MDGVVSLFARNGDDFRVRIAVQIGDRRVRLSEETCGTDRYDPGPSIELSRHGKWSIDPGCAPGPEKVAILVDCARTCDHFKIAIQVEIGSLRRGIGAYSS